MSAVYWSEKRQRWRKDDEEEPVKVKDISTVVLCTGYLSNLDIIEDDLQYDDEGEWEASKGWTMENNALTISVGNPSPSKKLDVGATCYPSRFMFCSFTAWPIVSVMMANCAYRFHRG